MADGSDETSPKIGLRLKMTMWLIHAPFIALLLTVLVAEAAIKWGWRAWWHLTSLLPPGSGRYQLGRAGRAGEWTE
jgi:hypothetical protein